MRSCNRVVNGPQILAVRPRPFVDRCALTEKGYADIKRRIETGFVVFLRP